MKRRLIVSVVVTGANLLVFGAANAAVTIVGRGPASDCYQAATRARRDRIALDRCDLALESQFLTPQDQAATLVNRSIIHLRRNEGASAIADLDTAIALDPSLAEARIVRGAALVTLHRFQEAVDELTRALELGPAHPERAYFHRAAAYEELGDLRAAYRDYTRAAELAPGWRAPREELTRFQVRTQ